MDPKRTVMIVDDMPFMRSILAGILTVGGYTVVAEASCGDEAIESYLTHRPSIIMMDLHMPEVGGIEAAQRIKMSDSNACIIFCGVTVNDRQEHRDLFGLHPTINKPYHAEEVWQTLGRMTGMATCR